MFLFIHSNTRSALVLCYPHAPHALATIGPAVFPCRYAAAAWSPPPISLFPPDSNVDNAPRISTMTTMCNSTRPDLLVLAGLYLQNEQSFPVRRFVHRFLAGEISAREAVARIRQHPEVLDEDPFPDDRPDV